MVSLKFRVNKCTQVYRKGLPNVQSLALSGHNESYEVCNVLPSKIVPLISNNFAFQLWLPTLVKVLQGQKFCGVNRLVGVGRGSTWLANFAAPSDDMDGAGAIRLARRLSPLARCVATSAIFGILLTPDINVEITKSEIGEGEVRERTTQDTATSFDRIAHALSRTWARCSMSIDALVFEYSLCSLRLKG